MTLSWETPVSCRRTRCLCWLRVSLRVRTPTMSCARRFYLFWKSTDGVTVLSEGFSRFFFFFSIYFFLFSPLNLEVAFPPSSSVCGVAEFFPSARCLCFSQAKYQALCVRGWAGSCPSRYGRSASRFLFSDAKTTRKLTEPQIFP